MKFSKALKSHLKSGGLVRFARQSKPHIWFSLDEGYDIPVFIRENRNNGKTRTHLFSAYEILADDWAMITADNIMKVEIE